MLTIMKEKYIFFEKKGSKPLIIYGITNCKIQEEYYYSINQDYTLIYPNGRTKKVVFSILENEKEKKIQNIKKQMFFLSKNTTISQKDKTDLIKIYQYQLQKLIENKKNIK